LPSYSDLSFVGAAFPGGAISPTKNPRLTGNRGFLENLFIGLAVPSHDASPASAAVPTGHLSRDGLALEADCNPSHHTLTRLTKHHPPQFVKKSPNKLNPAGARRNSSVASGTSSA
jgi:hypothetical protein